ncbi:glycosyltransferase family 1 protein, partial [Patescibacteria group bacterium]
LRKNPVDVYHTQYITPLFVSRKIKVITHIHDVSFAVYPQYIKKSDLFFLRMLIPLSLRRADKIIAVSDFTRTEIIRHYGIAPEKVVRTYNALDGAFQRVTNADLLETVRQKYALPEQFILYLGTMQPRKNLPALVRGFAKLTRRLPNIKLVLAGKRHGHNYDQQIDQALIESGVESTVCFPGYIEETDKAAILSLATAFAFPSVYEGFGVPVLEAFATEIPVTVSDLPVFHEVAGQAALFFDSGVLDQIGEILYTICTDKIVRERLVLEGKSRLKVFSWEQSARELIQIYESV